jgi:hypothetical protein
MPHSLPAQFMVEFEMNIVVVFENSYCVMETFPLTLSRCTIHCGGQAAPYTAEGATSRQRKRVTWETPP